MTVHLRIVHSGDHLWARYDGSDDETRLKDLTPEHADELLQEASVKFEEVAGKTIAAVHTGRVEGQWGYEIVKWLIFTDGTTHGFVLPTDGD